MKITNQKQQKMPLIIKNPATNQVITTVETDSNASLSQKLQTLKQGQKEWYAQPIEARAAVLMRFHDLLDTHKEDLAATLTSEVGKPLQQSRNEINGARTRIKWLCENAAKYLQDDWMVEQADMGERIVYEPLGVVCNISAWNYPYLVGINACIPALLAGNAVMYKPSEYATLTGMQIEKLLLEAGVPAQVFATAIGAGGVGDTLLELPFNGYFFTGSYKTGNYIYQKVAPKMVPCQLELGGGNKRIARVFALTRGGHREACG